MTTNNSVDTSPVQYNIQIGGPNGTIVNIPPSSTTGIPFISTGAASYPSFTFGPAEVTGGGTGQSGFTPFEIIVGGTTSIGGLQQVSGTGSANQVLTSQGASALPIWKNPLAAFSMNIQVFNNSGTYTPTVGMIYCTIECIAGGGGGGGITATIITTINAGGGGGAGGYARKTVSAATIGASVAITVGTGGAGGTTAGTNGSNGTSSSVGSIVSSTPGSGGTGSATASTSIFSLGGIGGIGSSGDINATGESGQPGFGLYDAITFEMSLGGAGGMSYFGGAASYIGGTASGASANGNSAVAYGSGGGGAYNTRSATAQSGGSGSAGVVIITEFI